MTSLVENKGCNLPLLDPSTRVLHQKWQYKAAAKAGLVSMVRVAMPYSPRCGSLDSLLRVADEQFQNVATRCGAQVVQHEWGLYAPSSESLLTEYFSEFVPRKHVLVARVDVVQNAKDVSEEQAETIKSANLDYFNDSENQSYIWYDGQRPEQYVYGQLPGEQETQLVAVDIEPRLAYASHS